MPEPVTYEFERTESVDRVGALLRALGTDLERGTAMEFTTGDRIVRVLPPEEVDFEIEVETTGSGDDAETEVEFELEWAGDGVTIDEADGESAGDAESESESESESEGERLSGIEGESTEEEEDPWVDAEPATVDPAGSKATFELFRDRAEDWRWRLRHDNGNIIADSGEGYSSLASARTGMRSVMRNAPGATVERED